ncbi:MAG: PTS sugar transporter subunit IIA [Cetobacterium sp.]|uniref:PTS sugar transporter subunit IIA n=1 Tax=Cetobacterium sp. TaxID=2071632 RepID=UPI003F403452
MKNILKGNISVKKKAENWKEAIEKAGEILLRKDYIEEKYIEAAIKNVEKLGNYIVLTDYVAMPHSRPEDGVKKTGMSLLVLKEPVDFLGEKINLIFMLASKDNSSHIEIIKKLAKLIDDETVIENLKKCETEEEILNII